jgi:EmrB/QacA subfamily drug resistance transporter
MTLTTTRPTPTERRLDPALRRLILVVLVGSVMTSLNISIVNVAINALDREFHAPLSTVQWLLTGYLLAMSMTIPITGWAMERFGAKTIWITSLVLFLLASVLSGLAWSIESLIVFRVLQGMGGGMLIPAGQTMLARAAGPLQMGRMTSVIAIPAMLAPVVGPVLGGLIVGNLNWRWMFFVNVPVCLVALLLAVRLLEPDRDRQRGRRLDVVGLALLSPGLAALVYGLSQAGTAAGLGNPRLLISVGTGLVLLAAFGWHALGPAEHPLVDLKVFRLRSVRAAICGFFGYTAAVLGMDLLLSLYLQTVREQTPLRTGMLLAPWGIGASITMLLSMRILDHRSPRIRAFVGTAPVLLGLLYFTQLGAGTPIPLVALAVFVIGLGHGVVIPALATALYQEVTRAQAAVASMLFNIVARVASSFGAALLAVVLQIQLRAQMPVVGQRGSLADASISDAPSAREPLALAFGHTYWVAFAIACLVLLAAARIPRTDWSAEAEHSEVEGPAVAAEPEGRKAS